MDHDDILAHIFSHCQPPEKNQIITTCRYWSSIGCDRMKMIYMNPKTISMMDKIEALVRYASEGNVVMTTLLLKSGVSPNSNNILGLEPCHVAKASCMKVLKHYGANLHTSKPSISLLKQALYQRDIEEYIALLEYASLKDINESLPVLAFFGYTEILINILEQYQFDCGVLNILLMSCVRLGRVSVIKWLIDHQVHVNIVIDNKSLLLFAIQQNKKVFKLILDHSHQTIVNTANQFGTTPLIYAVYYDDIDMTKLLLERQADIDVKINHYTSLLNYSIYRNHLPLATLLLSYHANVHTLTSDGWSSLCLAVYYCNIEMVQLLHGSTLHYRLPNDSKVDSRIKAGDTPLIIAQKLNKHDMVQLLSF